MKQPSDVFNDLQSRVSDLLKNSPAKDVERNVKAMLSQGFSKLDLVTREEFDTQAQVLARTRSPAPVCASRNSKSASPNSSRSSPRRKPDAPPGRKVRARAASCGPRPAPSSALRRPSFLAAPSALRSPSLFAARRS